MIDHPCFRAHLAAAQFARSGQWENAWRFDHARIPQAPDVTAYLDGASEVAFEVFCDEAFFGIRCQDTPATVERFALNCVAAFTNSSSGLGFVDLLVGLESMRNLGESFAFAEIGAVNAWQSSGPIRLNGLPTTDKEVENTLSQVAASALARNDSHAKAIEFMFGSDRPHWFGFPISEKKHPFGIKLSMLKGILSDFRA
jgi:hypothetical protein